MSLSQAEPCHTLPMSNSEQLGGTQYSPPELWGHLAVLPPPGTCLRYVPLSGGSIPFFCPTCVGEFWVAETVTDSIEGLGHGGAEEAGNRVRRTVALFLS